MKKQRITSPQRLLLPALLAGLTTAVGVQAATPVKEMSNTVEKLCPVLKQTAAGNPASLSAAEYDVLVRCGEVKIAPGQNFIGLSASQLNGLNNMTSEESSVMGASSTAVSGAQNIAILGRLSVLRGKSGATAGLTPQQQTPQAAGIPAQVFAQQVPAGESSDLGPMTVHGFGEGFSQMVDYGRWGAFLNGSFSLGNSDATTREPGYDLEALSMVAGLDYRLSDTFILGLALGYASIDSEIDNGGDLEKDGFGASVYGTWYMDKLYIDFLAGLAAGQYDMLRSVGYIVPATTGGTTVVNQDFTADSDATDITLALGGGYAMSFGGFGLTPFVQASYLYSDIDGYTEKLRNNNTAPGFGLALAVEEQEVESLATNVGVNLTRTFNASWGVLSPYLRFDWEHEYLNDSREIVARFAAVDQSFANLNRIIIPTDDPDRDFFNLGVGLSAVLPGGWQGFFDYSTVLGYDDLELHRFVVGLRWEF
jgi:outer membrane autotransporter protein